MTLKHVMIVPMFAAFFAIGCGADCESLCNDAKDCKGADQSVDCAGSCKKIEDLNDKAGCSDQYDDVVSCADDQDDICKPDANACKSQAEAYVKCLTKYCSDAAHATACQAAGG